MRKEKCYLNLQSGILKTLLKISKTKSCDGEIGSQETAQILPLALN